VQVGGCGLGRQGLQHGLQQFGGQRRGWQHGLQQFGGQQRDELQLGVETMLQSVLSPQQTPFPKPPMIQLMPLQMSLTPLSQREVQQLGRQLELQPGISNIETSPS